MGESARVRALNTRRFRVVKNPFLVVWFTFIRDPKLSILSEYTVILVGIYVYALPSRLLL